MCLHVCTNVCSLSIYTLGCIYGSETAGANDMHILIIDTHCRIASHQGCTIHQLLQEWFSKAITNPGITVFFFSLADHLDGKIFIITYMCIDLLIKLMYVDYLLAKCISFLVNYLFMLCGYISIRNFSFFIQTCKNT